MNPMLLELDFVILTRCRFEYNVILITFRTYFDGKWRSWL